MNKLVLYLSLSIMAVFIGCKDDDDPVDSYDYHAHIMQPSSSDKQIGDILSIQVEFESHSGEAVEHINVSIHNKTTGVEAYNQPADAHVSGGASDYLFEDQVELTVQNGFSPGDWVVTATVWGHDEGQDQEVETVEFHIHQ